MKKIIIKLFIFIFAVIVAACGCGNNGAGEATKNINADRTTVENTIKSYYSNEASASNSTLSDYFLNAKMSGVGNVKLMIKAYKVKKIQLIKLYNVKTHGNYAVMTSTFNTYFDGITNPKPDLEVIALKKENGIWYIVNDFQNISDSDSNWIKSTATSEQEQISSNTEINKLLVMSDTFNTNNKTFLDNGQVELSKLETANN